MKKHISELVVSIITLLFGIFMLLVGLNVFPFTAREVAYIAVCVYLCLTGTAVAVIQRNPIGLFFALCFATLIVSAVLLLTGYDSSEVYPIYIMAIPIGTLGSVRLPHSHTVEFASAAVIGAAAILMLHSFGVMTIEATLPVVVAYFAIIGIAYASFKLKNKVKDSDKEDI